MSISKEQINQIVRLKRQAEKLKLQAENLEDQIYSEAKNLLLEVSKYKKIENIDNLHFDHIDEGYIYYTGNVYTGRDYYNQDTYDEVEYELPAEFLYDENECNKYLDELKQHAQDKIDKEAERQAKLKLDQEAKEKAKYLELKSKFEKVGE